MTKIAFLIAFILSISVASAEIVRFDNYKLVRLNPTTEDHIKLIASFENDPNFDIWNGIKGVNIDIDVSLSPDAFIKYKPIFEYFQISYKIIDENIQNKFDEQLISMKNSQKQSSIVGRYARYTEVVSFINTLTQNNPDLVTSYTAGTTYEKREIKVIVLKTPTSDRSIWIDCGIHAREWASPATCIYFVDKLIKEYRANESTTVDLLSKYEFHIMPIVNPDGYEYTFNTYRMWRKNRNPNSGSSCIGTDLNRNFDFKWMVSGSSLQPCADTYAGPFGGSELETQAVQNSIKLKAGKWDMFYTLHSYGAYWMPPWGYTSVLPSDYLELATLSKVAVDAIKAVYGIQYKIGPPHLSVSYSASGGSYDWAKALYGVKYAYALELRPQQGTDEDIYGFALPENRAILCGEETYAGLKAIIKAIYNL